MQRTAGKIGFPLLLGLIALAGSYVGGMSPGNALELATVIAFGAALMLLIIDIEKRMSGLTRRLDQRLAKADQSADQSADLAAIMTDSVFDAPLLMKFLEATGKVDSRITPLMQCLAQRQLETLTWFIQRLSVVGEVSHEGEDREWMLGLTNDAQHTIDGISLTTVDAGTRGFDGGLWTSDLGTRYLEYQREAIDRGVRIRRIFIFENAELAANETFQKITKRQRDIGVEVRMLDQQLIPEALQPLIFDVIIFDEALSYETTPATAFAGNVRPAIVRTTLDPKPDRVRKLQDQFERLWVAADPDRSIEDHRYETNSSKSRPERNSPYTGNNFAGTYATASVTEGENHENDLPRRPSSGPRPPMPPSTEEEEQPVRFLSGILPERAPADARLSLLVMVTVHRFAGSSAALKNFSVSSAGTYLTITVSAPGLIPQGDLEQELFVPPDTDSEPVRFGFITGPAGLHSATIRAFSGGTFLGELKLQISVEPGAALEEARTQSMALEGLASEPGEVTLQVSRTYDDRYSFQLISEAWNPVEVTRRLAGDPTRVVGALVEELRAMSSNQSRFASASMARNRIQNLGAQLWADVVPDTIRRQFWTQGNRIRLFTIASDMDTVPWELLYPVDGENDRGFLAEQFPVLRRVYSQGRTRVLRLNNGTAYIVPPGSPANAMTEVKEVQDIFPATVPNRGVHTDLEDVIELLKAAPSVLHFACHNTFTENEGSTIALNGGPLRPSDLSRAVQKKELAAISPLVFLNACRSAGDIPGLLQLMGWARQFMGAGAGAFIGSLWAVRSNSAKMFAEEFYRAMLQEEMPLGTASLHARKAISSDPGDPTWLAYAIYGNPSASIKQDMPRSRPKGTQ